MPAPILSSAPFFAVSGGGEEDEAQTTTTTMKKTNNKKKMILCGSEQLPCHHKMVIGEITRSQQLAARLKSLMLSSPPAPEKWAAELAGVLFDELFQSYAVSVSMLLRPCNCYSEPADGNSSDGIRALEEEKDGVKEPPERMDFNYVPDARRKLQSKTSTMSNRHQYGHQRRKSGKKKTRNGEIPREEQQSWTTVTPAPHLDGHQWRKYGEKHISNSEFPRNYYRCSHFKEKGCQATKTVQQKDGSDERTRFIVTYRMHHTCKSMDLIYQLLEEPTAQRASVISFTPVDIPMKKQTGRRSTDDHPMLIDLNLNVESK